MTKLDRADLFEVLMSHLRISAKRDDLHLVIAPGLWLRFDTDEGNRQERNLIDELEASHKGARRMEILRLINRTRQSLSPPDKEGKKLDIPKLWGLLGQDHLTDDRFSPAIRADQFEQWRRHTRAVDEDLVPLWRLAELEDGVGSESELMKYLADWRTFLPGDQPQLYDELANGVACLHMHLAAAYPAPFLWVALMNERVNMEDIFKDTVASNAAELETLSKDSKVELEKMFEAAKRARIALFDMVARMAPLDDDRDIQTILNQIPLLQSDLTLQTTPGAHQKDRIRVARNHQHGCTDYIHNSIPTPSGARCPSLIGERWLVFRLLTILNTLRKNPSSKYALTFECALWTYLESKSSFLNLLQQGRLFPNWEGFKFCLTRNIWRSTDQRNLMGVEIGHFLQESRSVTKLELMIAPVRTGTITTAGCENCGHALAADEQVKRQYSDTWELIATIRKTMSECLLPTLKRQMPEVQVGIIVHFIKQWGEYLTARSVDDGAAYRVFHEKFRNECLEDLEGLTTYLESSQNTHRIPVVAIDGANTEEYCPPEVFGKLFRQANRDFRRYLNSGQVASNRKTFHVGEVFPYLGTGLRRIYEAIQFLKLAAGDRLGHACALGLDIHEYLRANPTVELSRLDYLDDTIFEWHLLTKYKTGHEARVTQLERRIAELSEKIYGDPIQASILVDSWLKRGDDFMSPGHKSYSAASIPSWVKAQGRALKSRFPKLLISERIGTHGLNRSLSDLAHLQPHEQDSVPTTHAERLCYEYLCDVTTIHKGLVPMQLSVGSEAEHLNRMQEVMQKIVADSGIAIESNPTSNWLISSCERQTDIPAVQWERRRSPEAALTVTINPDDPSVFSTSIENEYFFVFAALQAPPHGLSRAEALERIRRLRVNALQASFLK